MSSLLDADEVLSRLFGSVSRARILQLLVSKAGRTFYQREIMFETGLSLQPTQRELKNLFELGIIQKRETADRVYYEVDSSSLLFKALVELCKTAKATR